MLNADGGHPGVDAQHAAIRRWTAPADCSVSVSGTLKRPSAEGDGVLARIISSRLGEVAHFAADPKASVPTEADRIEVKKGDTLDFLVECRATDTSDGFQWAPLLRAEHGEWSAQSAFAGPPSPRPAALTRWEKYAQVLLAANEFVFVD